MIEKLIEQFSELDDPRCPGKVEHRLVDILVIAVCAVIACAQSWEDIALYGRSKLGWLRQFLALPNGIPSHDTEPPRLSRRLQHLRVWSHEDINQLFTGSQGASRSHGAGASRRA